MNKNQKLILLICVLFSILFLILSKSLEPQVFRFQKYTDRDEIAIYIYKYDKLPRNYIKKINDITHAEVSERLSKGQSFGGDKFRYEGPIINLTDNEDLIEADYYPNLEERIAEGKRGTYRLVFTASGRKEFFYTEDHYETFKELNISRKFVASNIMTVFQWISYSGVIIIIVQHQVILNRRKKNE